MSSELTHNLGQFDEVIHIIDNARSRAMKAVNAELIQMYWSVGAYLSELCSASSFGDKIIDEFVTPLVTQISWTNHLLIMSGVRL